MATDLYQILEQQKPLEQVLQEVPTLTPQQQRELAKLKRELEKDFSACSIEDVLEGDKRYALNTIMIDLLPRLEVARKNYLNLGMERVYPNYDIIIKGYLHNVKKQFDSEFGDVPHADKYWKTLEEVMCGDVSRAYQQIALRKNATESSFLYRYVYGNRYAVTALTALPGLATLRMPYSTPLVMAALGAIGAKVIDPFFQKVHYEDVGHLADMIIHRQKDMVERVMKNRDEQSFTIQGILRNVIPKLEMARMAGEGYVNYQTIVEDHLVDLRKEVQKVTGLTQSEWRGVELVVRDEFLPTFGIYAAEQNKMEKRGKGYMFLMKKSVSAVLTAGILSPLYLSVGRMLPFGVVDDILMAGIFGAVGYHIPNWLHPNYNPLEKIYADYTQRKKLQLPIHISDEKFRKE